MGRAPCCEKNGLKKGPWTQEEDKKLVDYIERHGHGSWRALPGRAGLPRCGKSCRLRWTNYLRPDIKRGKFSSQEEQTVINLHAVLGNKWSAIASHLPGRTDNEIKNTWNTHLKKRLLQMGIDPVTHRPITDLMDCSSMSYFSDPTLSHIAQWENALRLEAERRIIMREYFRQAAMAEHGITAPDLLTRRPDDSFGIDINSVAYRTWASQQPYNGISLDYNAGLPQYSLVEQLVQQEQRNRNDSLILGNQSNDSSINQNQGCNINMFSDGICSLALGSSSSTPLMQMDPSVQHLPHNISTISSIDHYNVSYNLPSAEPALMSASESTFCKNSRDNFVPEMNSSSSMINSMNSHLPEFPSELPTDTKATTGSSTFSDLKYEDGKDYWCNMLKLVGIVSPVHQVEATDEERPLSASTQRIGSHGKITELLDIIHDDLIMFEESNELRNQVEIIQTTAPGDYNDKQWSETYE